MQDEEVLSLEIKDNLVRIIVLIVKLFRTTTGAVQKALKSQENRFGYWPYRLQEAIFNRRNGFLHSLRTFIALWTPFRAHRPSQRARGCCQAASEWAGQVWGRLAPRVCRAENQTSSATPSAPCGPFSKTPNLAQKFLFRVQIGK